MQPEYGFRPEPKDERCEICAAIAFAFVVAVFLVIWAVWGNPLDLLA